MSNIDLLKIEEAVKMILEAVGEDVNREGLLDTPKRVAKMYAEMFSGLHEDAKDYFKTVFHEDHEELVLVKDIPFYSMCEHHLVPFYGKAHVAYIPNDGVVAGLSKLGRAIGDDCPQTTTTRAYYLFSSRHNYGDAFAKRCLCCDRG